MKYFIIILILIIAYLSIEYFIFSNKLKISEKLVEEARSFSNVSADTAKTILVLGDSSAYGVGASGPENTIAGKLYKHEQATYLENNSVSGAKIVDLSDQLIKSKLPKYNIILIQIGGNDIARFRSADDSEIEWKNILDHLPQYDRLIVISAGNVGGAPIFPWFLKTLLRKLNLKYHDFFTRSIENLAGTKYINMYEDPATDPFVQKSEIYFAPDEFHPSDKGYEIWFDKIINN